MTKRTSIDLTFGALTLLFVGLSLRDPSNAFWRDAPLYTVLIGSGWSWEVARKEPTAPSRNVAWLWPVLAVAMAVQFVWSSDDASRLNSELLGAALVAAASAMAWIRRRAR